MNCKFNDAIYVPYMLYVREKIREAKTHLPRLLMPPMTARTDLISDLYFHRHQNVHLFLSGNSSLTLRRGSFCLAFTSSLTPGTLGIHGLLDLFLTGLFGLGTMDLTERKQTCQLKVEHDKNQLRYKTYVFHKSALVLEGIAFA